MKTNAIIRIILYSLAIIVLLTILGVGIAAGELMFDSDSFFSSTGGTESSSGAVPADQIRSIQIDWAAGNIRIHPGEVTEICFTESLDSNQEPMVWKQSGDTLKIEYQKNSSMNFGNYSGKDLVIEVPVYWLCDQLEIDAAAADLEVTNLIITKAEFDGASGRCRFDNCQLDELDLNTASGNVQFTGTLNALDCEAVSADCTIDLTNTPRRMEMETVSGNLKLILPKDSGFTAEVTTLSGQFSSDFDTTISGSKYVSGDGAVKISVTALSGNVTINKR